MLRRDARAADPALFPQPGLPGLGAQRPLDPLAGLRGVIPDGAEGAMAAWAEELREPDHQVPSSVAFSLAASMCGRCSIANVIARARAARRSSLGNVSASSTYVAP